MGLNNVGVSFTSVVVCHVLAHGELYFAHLSPIGKSDASYHVTAQFYDESFDSDNLTCSLWFRLSALSVHFVSADSCGLACFAIYLLSEQTCDCEELHETTL